MYSILTQINCYGVQGKAQWTALGVGGGLRDYGREFELDLAG